MLRLAAAFLLVIGLVGCVSTPVSIKEARPVKADRLLAYQTLTAGRTATITVVRDISAVGGMCNMGLWINKKLAARIAMGEVATFYVEAGEVLFKVGGDPEGKAPLCTGDTHWIQRETLLRPDEAKVFRISVSPDFIPDITRADEY